MAQKTLCEFSVPLLAWFPGDPLSTLGTQTSRSRQASLPWCRLAHSVGKPMKMQVHISKSSWSCEVPSPSGESLKMPSNSVSSHSPCSGEQSFGSMWTVRLWKHGTNVPLCSSWSSSHWAKPTPFEGGFWVSNRRQLNQSPKRGSSSKSTSWLDLTTRWVIGSFCRTFAMGWL